MCLQHCVQDKSMRRPQHLSLVEHACALQGIADARSAMQQLQQTLTEQQQAHV